MVVVAEAAERDQRGWGDEPAAAEVIVLILNLRRPVLGEHVFQTGADGVAVAMAAIERERDRGASERQGFVVIGIGIAALNVEQGRAPGITGRAGPRGGGRLGVCC